MMNVKGGVGHNVSQDNVPHDNNSHNMHEASKLKDRSFSALSPIIAIILAAGTGSRSGQAKPKQFVPIRGKPLFRHSLDYFDQDPFIDEIILVHPQSFEIEIREILGEALFKKGRLTLCTGGLSRMESVANALNLIKRREIQMRRGPSDEKGQGLTYRCESEGAYVFIHDAARPFISHGLTGHMLNIISHVDGVVPVLPAIDSLIKGGDRDIEKNGMKDNNDNDDRINHVSSYLNRQEIYRVQTPQLFAFDTIYAAHKAAQSQSLPHASDDAQLILNKGGKIAYIEGSEEMRKFTMPEDFKAQALLPMDNAKLDMSSPTSTLSAQKAKIKEAAMNEKEEDARPLLLPHVGFGYDVHRLVKGKELWLGGVKIPHEMGLLGHSDADVLLHAIVDSMLGSISEGDIGDHFPPSDPQWKNAPSSHFVEHAHALFKERGVEIVNLDCLCICERPKIKPYRQAIKENIARLLRIGVDAVNVKATTTEKLGFTGREEGIAAQATIMVYRLV